MNNMNVFLKQTMAEYLDLHNKYEVIEGHELDRFTVFLDMDDGYIAYQIYYIDDSRETIIVDFEPNKRKFMVWNHYGCSTLFTQRR